MISSTSTIPPDLATNSLNLYKIKQSEQILLIILDFTVDPTHLQSHEFLQVITVRPPPSQEKFEVTGHWISDVFHGNSKCLSHQMDPPHTKSLSGCFKVTVTPVKAPYLNLYPRLIVVSTWM